MVTASTTQTELNEKPPSRADGTQRPNPDDHRCACQHRGPYLLHAHDHRVSSGADSHALGLNVQFHDALATVREKESVTPTGLGSAGGTGCRPTALRSSTVTSTKEQAG